jgi:hypothetical protein
MLTMIRCLMTIGCKAMPVQMKTNNEVHNDDM